MLVSWSIIKSHNFFLFTQKYIGKRQSQIEIWRYLYFSSLVEIVLFSFSFYLFKTGSYHMLNNVKYNEDTTIIFFKGLLCGCSSTCQCIIIIIFIFQIQKLPSLVYFCLTVFTVQFDNLQSFEKSLLP